MNQRRVQTVIQLIRIWLGSDLQIRIWEGSGIHNFARNFWIGRSYYVLFQVLVFVFKQKLSIDCGRRLDYDWLVILCFFFVSLYFSLVFFEFLPGVKGSEPDYQFFFCWWIPPISIISPLSWQDNLITLRIFKLKFSLNHTFPHPCLFFPIFPFSLMQLEEAKTA